VVLNEEGGVFTLSIAESVGGGQASGLVKGQASIVLDGAEALKLGEALLNSKLPANLQPMASVIEAVVNQAIAAIE
jgi:hypothetical protein